MGWILHAVWDIAVPHSVTLLPHWWTVWCLGFDVTVGLYLWFGHKEIEPSMRRTVMRLQQARAHMTNDS
mgnify:CR=1 FL=1